MQEQSTALREYMSEKGLSQAQLAADAKVSQSTVSRALKGESERYSQARHRLLTYAGIKQSTAELSTGDGANQVVRAFNRIWDGSEAHALRVAKIVDALAGLRPVESTKKGGRVEGQRKSTQKAPKNRRPKRRGN
jgi:transcriptional regulator with XRE-family HTH domain